MQKLDMVGSYFGMRYWLMNEEQQYVTFNDRKYLKTESDNKTYLTDVSDNEVKVDLRFSKDKDRNEKAIKGVKRFLQEVLPKEKG